MAAISITIVVIAIAASLIFSRTISRPITKLRDAATEIGKGNLDTRIEIKSKDEIGQLSRAFDKMSEDLRASHLRLKESHKQLEEKVQERTAKLSSSNENLEEEIAERTSAQKILEKRIKELNCLFGLSKLVEQPGISLEQIFQEIPELIRIAYQEPDITCVRIAFDGIQYKTDNFEKSEVSQYAPIKVHGEKAGDIEVYYLGGKAESGESPFLKEECDLLDAVAKHLGSVADRIQTKEKLQLFRNLIDRSNDSIFVTEPQWGRFLDVNDRACDSLGYKREELLDMSLKDIDESIPDDSSWQEQVEELKLKGDLVIEGQHRRKDGTTFFVETSLKLLRQKKEDYIIGIARDITERKLAEERQAELLQQVESVNNELKDFAYIVSHDLKAPLRGIKTLADWISTDYADKLDEDGREQMNLLSNRVQRMHNLIDGVLQYSRVGREKVKQVRVNLNVLVSEVIEMIAPPENIEITVENEMPEVECGETRIMQVFQNLLSNAVKYMDKPQGQITIGCVEENGFWKFSVADNGPGIEEKYFEKIFQIFQTLSPRDEFESTGVGLSVVKKIVELFGGKIWVESKPGEGSTFFFMLPKQESEVVDDAQLEANIVS
jgi:PAS domain S-box-containing protein